MTVGEDDPNKNPWAVDYGRLTPLIVQAIQDMNLKVQSIPTLSNKTLYSKIADFLRGIAEQGTAIVDKVTANFISTNKVDTHELNTDTLCIDPTENRVCVIPDQP